MHARYDHSDAIVLLLLLLLPSQPSRIGDDLLCYLIVIVSSDIQFTSVYNCLLELLLQIAISRNNCCCCVCLVWFRQDLEDKEGLKNASTVLLSGAGAGSFGAIHHVDYTMYVCMCTH